MSIEDELKHGKVKVMHRAMIEKCPFVIITPEHYRDDGSCRCNEREHTIMQEWGYTWDDTAQRWTGDDDAA